MGASAAFSVIFLRFLRKRACNETVNMVNFLMSPYIGAQNIVLNAIRFVLG